MGDGITEIIILKMNSVDKKSDQNDEELLGQNGIKYNIMTDTNNSKLYIDVFRHKVSVGGEEKQLTNLEFNLLIYLSSQPNRVFTYQQIYEAVWKEPYAYEKNNIMTHISHLRAKIEPDPVHPRYIENVRGVGYRFKKQ